MSRPNGDGAEHTKAAAVFTGIMAVCAGFTGLAAAGLILAVDYLVHGDPSERADIAARRAARRRDRYADAVAWLEEDRAARERHRQALRDWYAGDPATRGERPSSGETLGWLAARCWNGAVVGLGRFLRGWKAGREAARKRREEGARNWWNPPTPGRPNRDQGDTGPGGDTQPGPPPPAGKPQPEPPANPGSNPPPTTEQAPPDDDVVDAEIVEDTHPPASRDVIPVGVDQPTGPDPRIAEYEQRIGALAGEVQATRSGPPHP